MRIFIAVRLTEEMKNSLAEILAQLQSHGVRGNFSRPDNLHLTLAFIGETSRLKEIHNAVEEVALTPFEITLGKPGSFRDILWLGINGEEQMQALAASLRDSLSRHGICYDDKPFKAHITLARGVNAERLPPLTVPPARMEVSRVSVMKSGRVDGMLRYIEI